MTNQSNVISIIESRAIESQLGILVIIGCRSTLKKMNIKYVIPSNKRMSKKKSSRAVLDEYSIPVI
jgi:hypothetical protein